MNRRSFLGSAILFPLAIMAMSNKEIFDMLSDAENNAIMPALFVGHGNPMNAIEENEFVAGFRNMAAAIPKPLSVLCISAHWETKGSFVTAMPMPKTIHDFGGFPQALFDVQYPAKGSPVLADETKSLVKKTEIGLDNQWGLDHGCWSVLKHFYPQADIPIVQLSLDYSQPPQYHYELAKELYQLRKKGVLIIGSGNMVHNLGKIDWANLNKIGFAFDWATIANEKMKSLMLANDHKQLINYRSLGKEVELSIPSPEHYLPLLYILALKQENEKLSFFNDKAVGGSLTMTSVKIEGV
jgi:4,5-DOPA dioxygenase extradiol